MILFAFFSCSFTVWHINCSLVDLTVDIAQMRPTLLFGVAMYTGVQVAFKVCVDLLLLCMEFSDNLSVNFMEVIHEPVSFISFLWSMMQKQFLTVLLTTGQSCTAYSRSVRLVSSMSLR